VFRPVDSLDISASDFHAWQGRTTKAHWPFVEAEDAARGEKGRRNTRMICRTGH
jgi:hypothetical protein